MTRFALHIACLLFLLLGGKSYASGAVEVSKDFKPFAQTVSAQANENLHQVLIADTDFGSDEDNFSKHNTSDKITAAVICTLFNFVQAYLNESSDGNNSVRFETPENIGHLPIYLSNRVLRI